MPDPTPPSLRRSLAAWGLPAVPRPELGDPRWVAPTGATPSLRASGVGGAVVSRSTLGGRPTVDARPAPGRVTSSTGAIVRDAWIAPPEYTGRGTRRTVAQDPRSPHAP